MEDTNDNESQFYEQQAQQLRKKTTLLSNQLIELTYNDCNNPNIIEKFIAKLEQFNQMACENIEEEKYHHAAVYLDEAEKILQYSAGCGKTIERTLITTILNNQACLLQRMSQFEQSANYLEAIIYNITQFLQSFCSLEFNSNMLDVDSNAFVEISTYFERKSALALYHLRFCALSSHSKNHEMAHKSALKAVGLLKELCIDQYHFQIYKISNQSQKVGESRSRKQQIKYKHLLKELSFIKEVNWQNQQFQTYLANTLNHIKNFQKRIQIQQPFEEISNIFESYSIGNLMQASPLPFLSKQSQKEFMKMQFSSMGKMYRTIHMSMAYFTVATQLRLLSANKYSLDDSQRKKSKQFQQSKLYHLISIVLLAKYFPCKSVFFDHVIFSFKNHYQMNLIEMSSNYNPANQESKSFIEQVVNIHNKHSPHPSIQDDIESLSEHRTVQIHSNKILEELPLQGILKAESQNQQNINESKAKQIKHSNNYSTKLSREKLKSIKDSKVYQQTTKNETERLFTNYFSSKNKENKSRTKLTSSKKILVSRKKQRLKTEVIEDDKKGIYYEKTVKSRSKSKKGLILQRKYSKSKLLKTIVSDSKKQKVENKIEQQYGMRSTTGFTQAPITKAKKLKGSKNIQNVEIQSIYTLKHNKMISPEVKKVRQLKSPRNNKHETNNFMKVKGFSKDKFTI